MALVELHNTLKYLLGKHDQKAHGHKNSTYSNVTVMTFAEFRDLQAKQNRQYSTLPKKPAHIGQYSEEFFDWMGEASRSHIPAALDKYGYFSTKLNQALRHGKELSESEAAIVKGLDEGLAMKAAKLPNAVVAYRGLPKFVYEGKEEFTDVGYSSTSISAAAAQSFGSVIKVYLPKGTPVLANGYTEQELILPRNISFRKFEDGWLVTK